MSNILVSQYKDKLKSVILSVYGNQISPEFIDTFLNKICEKADQKQLFANTRNLYEYNYHTQLDINQVMRDIVDEHLNIHANGMFSTNVKPINYYIIDGWMSDRDVYKKLMLEAKAAGNQEEERYNNDRQNDTKEKTNSIYGASTMSKGFVSNVDMGGAITAQARNFISEMVWNIERFLGMNFTFENINEIFCWFDELFKLKSKLDCKRLIDEYIDYIPTPDDCRKKFVYVTKDIKNFRKDSEPITKTTFLFFELMSPENRMFWYYVYDPLTLMAKNPKIAALMQKLIHAKVEFINPYMFSKIKPEMTFAEVVQHFIKDGKTQSEAESIADFYENLVLFRTLIQTFCFATIINGNRVEKYKYRRRKVCVIGDTDSTMPSLYEIVDKTFKLFGTPELMRDSDYEIRLTMIYISCIDALMSEACMNFVVCCNQYNEGEKFYMYMKNEFFFPIVLLFNMKKNYIGIQTIQEGRMLPPHKQLAITGRELGAAALNEYVSSKILSIINDDVLRADEFNPLKVYKDVVEVRNHIKDSIHRRDRTFGVYAKFKGADSVKNPETTANVRGTLIWNNIYPQDTIAPGDAIYVFSTTLYSEEDLDKIPDTYKDIKENIRNYVFRPRGHLDFSRFGLKTFVMPADGDTLEIPEWILPFIDVNDLCEKHLHPIVALFPSLLLSPCTYVNQGSSTKKMGMSSLIRF